MKHSTGSECCGCCFHWCVCDWQGGCVFNLWGVDFATLWVWWAPATDITYWVLERWNVVKPQCVVCTWSGVKHLSLISERKKQSFFYVHVTGAQICFPLLVCWGVFYSYVTSCRFSCWSTVRVGCHEAHLWPAACPRCAHLCDLPAGRPGWRDEPRQLMNVHFSAVPCQPHPLSPIPSPPLSLFFFWDYVCAISALLVSVQRAVSRMTL